MPQEQGYQPQIDPREGTPRPMQSAAALGGQVGEALQQAGGMVHEQQLRAYEIERKAVANQELASAERAFAEHRRTMGDAVRNARETAKPGADGHTETIDKENDAGRQAIIDNITDPVVARHLSEQWGEWSDGLHNQEASWQQGKRIERLVDDTAEANNQTGNFIRGAGGNKAVYQSERQKRYAAIALYHVDDDTREKLFRDADNTAAVGYLLGLRDKDPAQANAELASGAFNFLPAGTIESIQSGNVVEIRRKQAELDHQRAVATAQGKDAIGVLEQKFSDGVPIADGDFDAAIAVAETIGDQSKAEALRGMKADNVNARVWSGQSPLARQNRVTELTGKGNKRSEPESRELTWLNEHRDPLDKQFDSDPVAYAIEHAPAGTGPPAADVRAPGGLQGRIDWARRAGPSYGRGQMPLFTGIEADAFARRKGEGQAGQSEVLQFLDQIPDEGMRKRAAAQIDPNDRVFQQLTLLKPQARYSVFSGAQALKANPQLLTPDKKEHPEVNDWMNGQLEAFNGATKLMNKQDRAAMQNVAMMFLAGQLSSNNISINQANPEYLRIGFVVATGGSFRHGVQFGGPMNRGDGETFIAPSDLSLPMFDKAVADDMISRKESPVQPDGHTTAWLRYAHPVLIGPDPENPSIYLYRWETKGGNVLQRRGGGDFISHVRNPD